MSQINRAKLSLVKSTVSEALRQADMVRTTTLFEAAAALCPGCRDLGTPIRWDDGSWLHARHVSSWKGSELCSASGIHELRHRTPSHYKDMGRL